MITMADEMDQLFNDIMSECGHEGFGILSHFSDSVRGRLEQYERKVRKQIVSRKENHCAALFYACETGKVEMVEYLISTCDADVEQRGYQDSFDKMVTPLWHEAAICRKPIIECLVRHGAQVNALSSFGTTPVLAACMQIDIDNSDVVEYLVEHGADIHRPNDHGQTCLMESVCNVKMCKFLLKNGVDVNARHNITNMTALHYAIYEGMLDTVKLLLDYGADVTLKSRDSGDALHTACLRSEISGVKNVACGRINDRRGVSRYSPPIFDYLVERGSYSPGSLADANELMGSVYYHDMHTTLKYWRKAIEIRNSKAVDGKPLAKTPSMPKRDCYRNASEFTSLDELDAIALDSDALTIQKLLIHERILGEHHTATFYVLERIGALYTEPFRYKNCFDLWRRALEIGTAANNMIFLGRVRGVAENLVLVMRHRLHEQTLEVADRNRDNDEEQARFADVVAIFKLLTNLLVTIQPPFEKLLAWNTIKEVYDNRDGILKCITELIYLLVKTARTSKAEVEVQALVGHLVNQNPISLRNHETLLHLCVISTDNTMKYCILCYDMQIFSNLEVTKLLLECKADVNARNEDGKTPLHIASCSENFSDQMVKLLLDHGAHLDTPDKSGSTPAHILSAKPDNTVDLGNYMTLRCHAAQAVVKHKIQCNVLPATLKQFLDLHRPPL